MGTSGIYAIRHKDTGRLYVGSARDIKGRWAEHRRTLRANIHHNVRLQRSWNKHGEGAFEFLIIHTVEVDGLTEWEQFWIDKLHPYYNILRRARSALGFRHSPETLAQLREFQNRPDRLAAVSAVHKGKITSEHTKRLMSEARKGRTFGPHKTPRSVEHRQKIAENHAAPYRLTSPTGEVIEIRNLSQFCRVNGLSQGTMGMVARGLRSHHKGWRCERLPDDYVIPDTFLARSA